MENTTPKNLIVNVVIDNSILVSELKVDQKVKQLVKNLSELSNPKVKLAIHVFDGLSSRTIKGFDDKKVDDFDFTGFPLINATLKEVMQKTQDYLISKTKEEDFPIHRPWMIILSSGLGYDKVDFFDKFETEKKEWQPALFPFLISNKFMTYDLSKINQVKPFMLIKDFQIESFGRWVKDMIAERLRAPANQAMRLDKNMFEGWIEL